MFERQCLIRLQGWQCGGSVPPSRPCSLITISCLPVAASPGGGKHWQSHWPTPSVQWVTPHWHPGHNNVITSRHQCHHHDRLRRVGQVGRRHDGQESRPEQSHPDQYQQRKDLWGGRTQIEQKFLTHVHVVKMFGRQTFVWLSRDGASL